MKIRKSLGKERNRFNDDEAFEITFEDLLRRIERLRDFKRVNKYLLENKKTTDPTITIILKEIVERLLVEGMHYTTIVRLFKESRSDKVFSRGIYKKSLKIKRQSIKIEKEGVVDSDGRKVLNSNGEQVMKEREVLPRVILETILDVRQEKKTQVETQEYKRRDLRNKFALDDGSREKEELIPRERPNKYKQKMKTKRVKGG